jgi:hypothetical protein
MVVAGPGSTCWVLAANTVLRSMAFAAPMMAAACSAADGDQLWAACLGPSVQQSQSHSPLCPPPATGPTKIPRRRARRPKRLSPLPRPWRLRETPPARPYLLLFLFHLGILPRPNSSHKARNPSIEPTMSQRSVQAPSRLTGLLHLPPQRGS